MSTLAEFTNRGLVIPSLRSRDASGVTAELCSTLHREGFVAELLPFYHAIISRENLSSTAAPPGWALPHARLAGLPRLAFALGRTREPMPWFGTSRQLVQVVFLSTVPPGQSAAYQNLVACLARLSHNRVQAENLLRAQDKEEILAILDNARLRQPRPVPART